MGVIQRQGIKNVIVNYLGLFIGYINILIVQPNYLKQEEVGLLRILFSFSALVATFLPMGINAITTKFFPQFQNPGKRHYGYFGMMLIFPIIGFLLLSAILLLFKSTIIGYYSEKSQLFTVYFSAIFPYILVLGLLSVLSAYSFVLLKTTVPVFINEIVIRVCLIALTIAYFFKLFTLDYLIYYTIAIYGIQLLLVFLYILYEDRPGIRIDFKYLKTQNPKGIVKYGLVISLGAFTFMGLKFIDSLMLGHYCSLEIVGIFSIAALIPTLIEAPLNALDKIAAPNISRAYAENNMQIIKDIYYKSTKYLILIGGLLFIGININIHYIYQLTAKDYSSGSTVVLIISIGTLINIATGLNDSIISYSSKYYYITYFVFLLFALAIINNMIFIPIYGMEGAALATCLSSLIYNSVKYFYIWRVFNLQPFDKFTVMTIFLIGLCFFINYFLPSFESPILNILIHSSIVTLVYLGGTYFLKIIPEFHRYIPFIKGEK